MLKSKILNKQSGIVTYGLTPPKKDNPIDKIEEISQKQIERIKGIGVDAIVVYDIQEESDRIEEERPFPFLPTIDPVIYCKEYFKSLDIPKIIYRCVGKYTAEELIEWINQDNLKDKFSVFVGAASRNQEVKLSLPEAYKISANINPNFILGGVTIPERHTKNSSEHLKVINKINRGCKFFISQAVYNVEAAKDFLSDYYYYCSKNDIEMAPIIFTITPCGSIKTLQFMKWLGVSIPKWLENELMNSEDILDKSVTLVKNIFEELLEFSVKKGIPIGCNIESVSVRKIEIEASIKLVKEIKELLANYLIY